MNNDAGDAHTLGIPKPPYNKTILLFNLIRMIWRVLVFVWSWFWRIVGWLLLVFILRYSTFPLHGEWNQISILVGGEKFDYVGWEAQALATKVEQTLWGVHPFMAEADRSQYVRDYMADLGQVYQLEAEINQIYLTESLEDAEAQTAELRSERDSLREDLRSRQPLAESILEGQVATVLTEEGFGTMGQLLPPIAMHFTQMPNLLVVSPRDRIERRVEMAVDPLPVEEAIALEERILDGRDMDAIVVPLGGLAIFPAMIQETANLSWAVETFAHEWIHHYFFFYPLGLSYFVDTGPAGREAVSINETAANLFGREIGRKVLERYYPELVAQQPLPATILISNISFSSDIASLTPSVSRWLPPPPISGEESTLGITQPDPPSLISGKGLGDGVKSSVYNQQPPAFDFGSTMNRTRVMVDEMLHAIHQTEAKADRLRQSDYTERADSLMQMAEDEIDRMHRFMDRRQQLFVANGYRVRKLNLAYFAFYGGYQAEGVPGIAGTDPTGPAIEDILAMSDDLHHFATIMRGITSREELLAVRDSMQAR